MSREIILKKLEQMKILLRELEEILALPFSEFTKQFTNIRTTERNLGLIVELASDINAHFLMEKGEKVPDSYRESFVAMNKKNIIPDRIIKPLVESAKLRNILVHEYDFDQDDSILYESAKSFLPVYKEYIGIMQKILDYSK